MRIAPTRTCLNIVLFTAVALGTAATQTASATSTTSPGTNGIASTEDVTIRLSARGRGLTWRGAIGDVIAVTTNNRGRDQVFEGRLLNFREINRNMATLTVAGTKPGASQERTFIVGDIVKIETVMDAADAPEEPVLDNDQGIDKENIAGDPEAPEVATSHAWGFHTTPGNDDPNMPKIFLLPIEGGVGEGTRHDEIKKIGAVADEYGPGQIIVFKVDSPGGMVVESDLIRKTMVDLNGRHRLIAWVKRAISAAAFTSLHCEEIYFMKTGALGSATMFAGTKAIEGEQLRQWVKHFGDVAEENGHPRFLAEAMCTNSEVCSYDPAKGDKGPVVYDTMEGEVKLSTDEENLTINTHDAIACGLADGVADNEDELAELLLLPRWYETNDEGRKIHQNWQKLILLADEELQTLGMTAQGQLGQTGNDPIKNLNIRLVAVKKLIAWARRLGPHTTGAKMGTSLENLEEVKRQLEDQIRRLKEQERNN